MTSPQNHQILGLQFFGGTSRDAVEEITRRGGLLVAPAAPSLINLCRDPDYRRALLSAEIAIADSGFMVLLWKLFAGDAIPRISGLEHMKRLLEHESMRDPGAVVWVVATEDSRTKLVEYLDGDKADRGQRTAESRNLKAEVGGRKTEKADKADSGQLKAEMQNTGEDEAQITKAVEENDEGGRMKDESGKAEVGDLTSEIGTEKDGERKDETPSASAFPNPHSEISVVSVSEVSFPTVYVAPKYGRPVEDEALLALVREKRPRHVVISVGGGIQDQLGEFLLERLDYRPAVHCIGAALGFITGDQVRIPEWADKCYLGWFFRSLAQPKVFIPRFWSARRLPWLIWKYRERLPPLEN